MKLYCFFNKDELLAYEYTSMTDEDISNYIRKIKTNKVKKVDVVIFEDEDIEEFYNQGRFKTLKEFIITKEKLILRKAKQVHEEITFKTKWQNHLDELDAIYSQDEVTKILENVAYIESLTDTSVIEYPNVIEEKEITRIGHFYRMEDYKLIEPTKV
jgi:nitrous oxide reductase